jgi:type IV secretion system protein TrbL
MTASRSRRRTPVALAALLVIFVALAGARPAAADPILDGIVRGYQGASSSWLARVAPLARTLFASLAALELVVSAIVWLLRSESLDGIFRGLARKFLLLGFFYALIALFPMFVPTVLYGLEQAGQQASGSLALSPSGVIDQGVFVTAQLFDNLTTAGLLAHPAGALLWPIVSLIVFLAFIAIAAQLVLALVESAFVLSAGALFLGFAGFRATATLADNFVLYAFQVGTKIFLLYMLVAVGQDLVGAWTRDLLDAGFFSTSGLQATLRILAGSVIYAFLVWRIPGHVAGFLTHNAQFRFRDALSA